MAVELCNNVGESTCQENVSARTIPTVELEAVTVAAAARRTSESYPCPQLQHQMKDTTSSSPSGPLGRKSRLRWRRCYDTRSGYLHSLHMFGEKFRTSRYLHSIARTNRRRSARGCKTSRPRLRIVQIGRFARIDRWIARIARTTVFLREFEIFARIARIGTGTTRGVLACVPHPPYCCATR